MDVSTGRGDRFTTRFLGVGTGPLHVAKLRDLPGIETDRGHSFHTSRGDYNYTAAAPTARP